MLPFRSSASGCCGSIVVVAAVDERRPRAVLSLLFLVLLFLQIGGIGVNGSMGRASNLVWTRG